MIAETLRATIELEFAVNAKPGFPFEPFVPFAVVFAKERPSAACRSLMLVRALRSLQSMLETALKFGFDSFIAPRRLQRAVVWSEPLRSSTSASGNPSFAAVFGSL